ncbi:MAG: retroviral-like aspartic protease family protein [Deltaproteobacteria bacterium]|nr:retroviral-like aspartic protease family protein [Deltaproteobacteria bacterium]
MDMILDTGAVLTVLSWSVLKAIGYDPAVTPERHEAITANGVIEVPKLRVNSISIGDAQARQIEVICHDIPNPLTLFVWLLLYAFSQRYVSPLL